jgi:murein DD-endopeptidase MepM/ murein hydrolase activator NlpD
VPLNRPPPPTASTAVAAPPNAVPPASGKAPPPAGTAAVPTAPDSSPVPEPKAMSGRKFLLPVNGKLTARFGSVSNGLHNDGINIAAPRGTPVRAAQNGVVAYAGNELKGFGNLLLIRHANGWMTAYAHNDVLLVKRGDQVKRGQVIARVGSTGNVATPQLHFELRHNTEAVDPTPNLGNS